MTNRLRPMPGRKHTKDFGPQRPPPYLSTATLSYSGCTITYYSATSYHGNRHKNRNRRPYATTPGG